MSVYLFFGGVISTGSLLGPECPCFSYIILCYLSSHDEKPTICLVIVQISTNARYDMHYREKKKNREAIFYSLGAIGSGHVFINS